MLMRAVDRVNQVNVMKLSYVCVRVYTDFMTDSKLKT